ncbi:MAG: GIY-YIG nuclease family protein [Paracoccus sp. (in: a-proteobacteria)]|nr:GIY-YIG nuclease family protein [Paracoccus sp. (in: a-proteobacteria)]
MKPYTTYAIRDPRDGCYIYVGQTSDYEKRVKTHLRPRKKRPNYGAGFENIKTRLYDMLSIGLAPEITPLETCHNEAASIESETRWVQKLAKEGHPLLNRWRKHRVITKREGVAPEAKKRAR